MSRISLHKASRRIFFVLLTAAFSINAEDVMLSEVKRLPEGKIQMKISGSCPDAVTLQVTADLKNWTDLQTFSLKGDPIYYTDENSPSVVRRAYRVRTSTNQPVIPALPDLGDAVNRVFPAPEGFNTVQFAADGKLGFIVWRDTDLIIRERAVNGTWSEQTVRSGGRTFQPYLSFEFLKPREDYRFQPSAVLLY